MAADGSSAEGLITTVERMITDVLDLDDTRYVPPAEHRPDPDRPVLDRDGTLRWRGHVVDVARDGLPTMDVIELEAGRGGDGGRFLLTAASRVGRPNREQLMVAATLAEQPPSPCPASASRSGAGRRQRSPTPWSQVTAISRTAAATARKSLRRILLWLLATVALTWLFGLRASTGSRLADACHQLRVGAQVAARGDDVPDRWG
jgi:hypothetical protein